MHLLNHISFGTTDLAPSAAFYDATLAALGYRRVCSGESFVGWGLIDDQDAFAVKLRKKHEVQIPGDGFHVAFTAPSRKAVDEFYRAAMKHGGKDNGGSGLHPEYGANYYAAFVFDPDGYRIEAVCHGPA
jgi:catechol 2,3-dioxygenase-like lactoylglutathione lyase family enzyme